MSNENSSEARADRKAAAAQKTPSSQTRAARLERRTSAGKAAEAQANPSPSKKELAAGGKRTAGRNARIKADDKKSRETRRSAAHAAAEAQANPPETKKEKAAREKREAAEAALEAVKVRGEKFTAFLKGIEESGADVLLPDGSKGHVVEIDTEKKQLSVKLENGNVSPFDFEQLKPAPKA